MSEDAVKPPEEATEVPEPPEEAAEVPEPPRVVDGLFISKHVDENGQILPPGITLNGNLGLLEVESLLKLALKEFQEKMGFS